ncbi:hypothetical protein AC579_6833 [Pseudocercospora musae]|uniref:Uncharacterized protein n=1 Tax=Pseudocercospora musae TaxID=113226 RepID=A0A139IQH1_9PEZI|nr:hypothetical protein AC579_6833 [Pseudocercospora musae]
MNDGQNEKLFMDLIVSYRVRNISEEGNAQERHSCTAWHCDVLVTKSLATGAMIRPSYCILTSLLTQLAVAQPVVQASLVPMVNGANHLPKLSFILTAEKGEP